MTSKEPGAADASRLKAHEESAHELECGEASGDEKDEAAVLAKSVRCGEPAVRRHGDGSSDS